MSGSDATDCRTHSPWKLVVKPLSDMRSEMERSLADLSVDTKSEVQAIV